MTQRLFIGSFPCGLVYADRHKEVGGDYQTLAFLSYKKLELEWRIKKPATHPLKDEIEASAAAMVARKGQLYQTSTAGQGVILGE